MRYAHDQRQSAIRLDWGQHGAAAVCRDADYAVIVDVLSFTTSLCVAIDSGAEVFPYRWQDATAQEFARQHDAILAVGRSEAASTDPASSGGSPLISLSPASIRAAPKLARIVLPSPNGSALASQLASGGATVLGACLRNRTAVARWLTSRRPNGPPPVIAVIAAGERWPDGSLRPAVEDLWGAGAIIAALDGLGMTGLSAEAQSAVAAYRAVKAALGPAMTACSSGIELAMAGFSSDLAIAADLDVSSCVPVLTGDRFRDASSLPRH